MLQPLGSSVGDEVFYDRCRHSGTIPRLQTPDTACTVALVAFATELEPPSASADPRLGRCTVIFLDSSMLTTLRPSWHPCNRVRSRRDPGEGVFAFAASAGVCCFLLLLRRGGRGDGVYLFAVGATESNNNKSSNSKITPIPRQEHVTGK